MLRAVGDARRAMYVTLAGAVATVFTDPLLIFAFGLGIYGAAWAMVLSPLVMLGFGLYGAIRVHDLVSRTRAGAIVTILPRYGDRRAGDPRQSRHAGRRAQSPASGRTSASRRSPAAR